MYRKQTALCNRRAVLGCGDLCGMLYGMKNATQKHTLPTFIFEKAARESGYRIVIGVDEAGRGPLAGPVVAAAAWYRSDSLIFPPEADRFARLIRDSKTLSEQQREDAYRWIVEHFETGVGIVDVETIDQVNILQATFLALRQAIDEVLKKCVRESESMGSIHILVDGNCTLPHVTYSQQTIVRGDAQVVSIAAASIVAKVTRDRLMRVFDNTYPKYGFAQHKGYGTAKHLEVLRQYGPCPIHRRSFAPVARLCREFARNEES